MSTQNFDIILHDGAQEETNVIILDENGKCKKSGKKFSKISNEKIQLNKDFKADIGGIFSVRKRVCKLGANYITALNDKFNTSLSIDFIMNADVNIFTQYQTEKEKKECKARAEKLGKNPIECPQFTAWLFIQLLGRYAKNNKVKK